VAQVVEVWRDISERRAAEARLAESHRLASLGLLASGFSHELNTPLATVLAAVEGIMRDTREARGDSGRSSRIGENAAIAREQVLRCRAVTQQFLRLSRGQASFVDIVDVGATVTSVARLVEPTARAHSVNVQVAVAAGELRVRADESELQQALVNLLLNAIQACEPGRKVIVRAEDGAGGTGGSHEKVRIVVQDEGCGIAPDQQKRIFEPFFSLRDGGTGLGLFLSLNFVRAWGGDITVDSAPGRGSTFQIVLPALAGGPGHEARL
jgi:signal transduction histidine kinase